MMYELIKITAAQDWQAYHQIRRKVLWQDRGQNDYDVNCAEEYEPSNHPMLFKVDACAVGTARVDMLDQGQAIVRLVAINTGLQRQGLGRVMSSLIESYASSLGIVSLFVNAAPQAVGFYQKLGWHCYIWDKEEQAGVAAECTQMRKRLKTLQYEFSRPLGPQYSRVCLTKKN